MKTFIILFLISLPIFASALKPQVGLYTCVNGNEESICDQELRPYFSAGRLSAVKVEYVGWCGSMGPYTYYCQDNICQDAGIRFDFKDDRHYRWENKQYGFVCDFAKK
jgi:hypothetical protein